MQKAIDAAVKWLESGECAESSSDAGQVDGVPFFEVEHRLSQELRDVEELPEGRAEQAVAPLTRLLDWAVRSHANPRVHKGARASAEVLEEYERIGANLSNIACFELAELALGTLLRLAPATGWNARRITLREDVPRAVGTAAAEWSDFELGVFAKVLHALHGPGGTFFLRREDVRQMGDDDARRRVVRALLEQSPAGEGRNLLAKVGRSKFGLQIRNGATRIARPRALPDTIEDALDLASRLGASATAELSCPPPEDTLAGVEQALALPDSLRRLYARTDGVGERCVAACAALVSLQAELRTWLAMEREDEPFEAEEPGDVERESLGPEGDILAIGRDLDGDFFLLRTGAGADDPRVYRLYHDWPWICAPIRASLGALVAGHCIETWARKSYDDRGPRLVQRHEKQVRGKRRPRSPSA